MWKHQDSFSQMDVAMKSSSFVVESLRTASVNWHDDSLADFSLASCEDAKWKEDMVDSDGNVGKPSRPVSSSVEIHESVNTNEFQKD